MIDRDYQAEVDFFDEYQQHIDSKEQADNNNKRLTANGPVDYVEIMEKHASDCEAKLKANGFSFAFDYYDVDTPNAEHMNIWTRPSISYREIDINDLS